MSNTINRRDFLGGTALVIAAGLTPLAQMRAEAGGYYPPSLTGLRGSHPGSFEVAHQVGREDKVFDTHVTSVTCYKRISSNILSSMVTLMPPLPRC
jgi:hypothetical protein